MNRCTLALVAATAALGCSSAYAAPATVNLRVEGETQTYFEGPVTTDGRNVTTAAGATHVCDGTNGGVNPSAGPTATAALETAEETGAFIWDGAYNGGFDDFFVERVGTDGQVGVFGAKFWSFKVNRVEPSVGGCQQRVQPGDSVTFTWEAFGDGNLVLSGVPAVAAAGQSFTVQVQQHAGDGVLSNAAGASVAGATTGADGRASVSFSTPGVQRFKATRAGAVRSNAAAVCIPPAGQADCGAATPGGPAGSAPRPPAAKDSKAPVASFSSVKNGKRYRKKGPRLFAGRIAEESALFQVYLKLRRTTAAGCQYFSGKREVWTKPGTCRKARFIRLGEKADWSYLLPKALPRGSYIAEVKALDMSLNADTEQVKFKVAR